MDLDSDAKIPCLMDPFEPRRLTLFSLACLSALCFKLKTSLTNSPMPLTGGMAGTLRGRTRGSERSLLGGAGLGANGPPCQGDEKPILSVLRILKAAE